MKIFNIEDGVKKVYVQKNDLGMLSRYTDEIPASIYMKMMFGTSEEPDIEDPVEFMKAGITIIDDSNRMEFLEFSDPAEIEFFEGQDWIIDFKELRYLTEEELKKKMDETINEMNAIAEKHNAMPDDEEEKTHLRTRHELLDYKMHTIPLIRWIQTGQEQIAFPVVPDSDGFTFSGENCDYMIKGSLDPNKILLFRKDGKKLEGSEQVPNGFIQMGMSIALTEREEKQIFFGNFDINHSFSPDHQYFVTEFKFHELGKDSKPEKTEETQEQEAPKQEKGLRRLLNRIFGKNVKTKTN